jgi:SAM-dependent methyltransferase
VNLRKRVSTGLWRAFDAVERRVFPEAADASEHWQRRVMNTSVERYIAKLGPSTLSAAEISGDAHERDGWKHYESLMYPEFDVCAPLAPDHPTFDVVICEQVLEHVTDPWGAVVNLQRLVHDGGHVIITSPFLIKVHELPMFGMHDYWRFTPRGLQTLLERAGLVVEKVDTWGNRVCVAGNLTRWSKYQRWLPLRNEPGVAVQIWAFASKPKTRDAAPASEVTSTRQGRQR